MSQAESLLNSITAYPTNATSVATSPINDYLVIDAEGRIINVPATEILFGVETDLNAERKYFQCPRIVGDNIDLTTLGLRVHYRNAQGEKDGYIVNDVKVSGEFIIFSWLLGGKLFKSKGTVHFAVCAVSVDEEGYETLEWNTTLASGTVLEGLDVDLSASEYSEASDLLQQLLDLLHTRSDEAVQAVTDEGTKQISNVEAAGTEQISLVESKGAETLATIPEDYTSTYNAADEALRKKAKAILLEETGEVISVDDASDDYVRGLKVFGKTEQYTTTGKNLIENTIYDMTYNGITITKNPDKSFYVNGTATDNCYFTINSGVSLPEGRYRLTGCDGNATTSTYILYVTNDIIYAQDVGDGADFNYSSDVPLPVRLAVYKGAVMNNVLIKPMLRAIDNGDDTYEPYTGGISSPNPEYPQEIVSLGALGNLFDDTNFREITLESAYYNLPLPITKAGTYTVNCSVKGVSEHGLTIAFGNAETTSIRQLSIKTNTPVTFEITEDELVNYTNMTIYTWSGSIGGTLHWIMLNHGNEVLDYRPYSGQKEIQAVLSGLNFVDVTQMILASNTSLKVSDDGYTVTVVGGSAKTYAYSHYDIPDCIIHSLRGKTVRLSVDSITKSVENAYSPVQINLKRANGSFLYPTAQDKKLSSTFVVPEDTIEMRFGVYTNNSASLLLKDNTVVAKGIRLTLADVTEYEEYKPVQSIIAKVKTGLAGIPTTSGGNYTDSNGQQWICDEVDFERGVYVQRIKEVTFDGSEGSWGINKYNYDVFGVYIFGTWINDIIPETYDNPLVCDKLQYQLWGHLTPTNRNKVYNTPNYIQIYLDDQSITTSEEFAEWLSNNPITVLYPLATPIETPLTADELNTFRALHTNYPNTVVLNDSGATMQLLYNADTKLFVLQNGGGGGNTTVSKLTVELKADSWVASSDGTYFTQNTGITVGENSKVDLQPTAEQLIELINDGISMFLANESGSLSAYAIGSVPASDMTIQATEMAVVYV